MCRLPGLWSTSGAHRQDRYAGDVMEEDMCVKDLCVL